MFRSLYSLLTTTLYIVAAIIVVAFAVTNREPVSLSFYPLPYTMQTPLFLFGILSFALGLLIGGLQGMLSVFRFRRELRNERKRIVALENELALLRARPSVDETASTLMP